MGNGPLGLDLAGWAAHGLGWIGRQAGLGRGRRAGPGVLLGQEQGKAGLGYWVGLLLGLGFAGFSSFLFFSFSN